MLEDLRRGDRSAIFFRFGKPRYKDIWFLLLLAIKLSVVNIHSYRSESTGLAVAALMAW